jgi:3-oxoacyl-(acyl-carrier-protein) synthase
MQAVTPYAQGAAIVGLGMVTPLGVTSEEHVFFIRAGEPPPLPSPFTTASGETLRVAYCPFIGAREAMGPRCVAMATAALDEALGPLERLPKGALLFVVTPDDRPGFSSADRAFIERVLLRRTGASAVVASRGAAGAFTALGEMATRLATQEAEVAVLCAVDSFIHVDALAEFLARGRHPWQPAVETPAEGAAVIVLGSPAFIAARVGGAASIGTLRGVASEIGASHDDNDLAVDGTAMTQALRRLPFAGPVGTVAGQLNVDPLRSAEWSYALARNADRFQSEHASVSIEDDVGHLGAAAGAMSMAYAIALRRHGATRASGAPGHPVMAWAISRDGTRGVGLAAVTGDV